MVSDFFRLEGSHWLLWGGGIKTEVRPDSGLIWMGWGWNREQETCRFLERLGNVYEINEGWMSVFAIIWVPICARHFMYSFT